MKSHFIFRAATHVFLSPICIVGQGNKTKKKWIYFSKLYKYSEIIIHYMQAVYTVRIMLLNISQYSSFSNQTF